MWKWEVIKDFLFLNYQCDHVQVSSDVTKENLFPDILRGELYDSVEKFGGFH